MGGNSDANNNAFTDAEEAREEKKNKKFVTEHFAEGDEVIEMLYDFQQGVIVPQTAEDVEKHDKYNKWSKVLGVASIVTMLSVTALGAELGDDLYEALGYAMSGGFAGAFGLSGAITLRGMAKEAKERVVNNAAVKKMRSVASMWGEKYSKNEMFDRVRQWNDDAKTIAAAEDLKRRRHDNVLGD